MVYKGFGSKLCLIIVFKIVKVSLSNHVLVMR